MLRTERAEPASAVTWQLDHPRASQHWWELSSTQGLEKPRPLLCLPAFSCWRQYWEAGQPWTSSTAQGQASHSKTEKRSPGAGDQGQLLMRSGVLKATGSKAAHTGGSCYWANDPNVPCGEAASHTRCFHRCESYQESEVYRERLKLSQLLLTLGRKQ